MEEPDILVIDDGWTLPAILASAAQRFGSFEVFACHSKECAPPPAGKGGSSKAPKASSGGGATQIKATSQSDALAKGIHALAVKSEPAISAELAQMVGDTHPKRYDTPPPAQLYGFKQRIKTEAKISEKIERIIVEKGMTHEQAAQDVKDAVRYTVHYPGDTFGDNAQAVVDRLRAENVSVTVKNTWPPESGVPYKGINVQVTTKEGLKYELQFHTPHSQKIKDTMHAIYEKQRVLPKSDPKWLQYEREMAIIAETIQVPTGAMEVFAMDEDTITYFKAEAFDGTVTAVAKLKGFETWTTTGNGWHESRILLQLAEDTGWVQIEDSEARELINQLSDQRIVDI